MTSDANEWRRVVRVVPPEPARAAVRATEAEGALVRVTLIQHATRTLAWPASFRPPSLASARADWRFDPLVVSF
jgi:hypothetical protein